LELGPGIVSSFNFFANASDPVKGMIRKGMKVAVIEVDLTRRRSSSKEEDASVEIRVHLFPV
jgi:hypothetical protein